MEREKISKRNENNKKRIEYTPFQALTSLPNTLLHAQRLLHSNKFSHGNNINKWCVCIFNQQKTFNIPVCYSYTRVTNDLRVNENKILNIIIQKKEKKTH